MRTFLLFIAILLVVTLGSTAAPSVTNATRAANKERAVTKFDYPVTLMTVLLKGEYLFVHDDAAMARGEACTLVYKGLSETPKNLVISFHCLPVVREEVATFTVRTLQVSPGQYELREFQFAYSKEAHLVPGNQHAEHVPITSVY
ncbi:MAG TPA: hypothetical protein VFH15_14935 [Pyrinomonadaceae bacterium]|nr:hypothetical protein [Pyrinomonadaceae bacterium]